MTSILDDDPQAAKYHRLRKGSGEYAADQYLARELRAGNVSPELLKIAADNIDPDVKAPRGRPAGGHLDPVWHEIGQDFESMRNTIGQEGKPTPIGQAISALADEYGSGERTIDDLVRSYSKQIASVHAQHDAWQAELNSWSAEEQHAYWDDFEREMAEIEADPAYVKAIRKSQKHIRSLLMEEAQLRQRCPHGCTKQCRRNQMLADRHLCPLSASPRNKFPN